jgi:hypothetical protein
LVSYDDFIYEIENGFQAHCFTFPDINYKHKIRIHESGTGYCLFSTIPPNVAHNFIYKTTNYGLNWTKAIKSLHHLMLRLLFRVFQNAL